MNRGNKVKEEIRAFLAIDIYDEHRDKIKNLQNEFKNTDTDIKYVETENIHLTFKFFGNITEQTVDDVSIAIEDSLKKYKPIEIAINGVGSFPNENYIRMIWVGIDENPTLIKLLKDLDDEFKKLGFKKERNYTPHLTIGRVKSPKNRDKIKEKIAELKDVEIGKQTISKIYLKKSKLTPKGPIYTNIKEFEL